MPTKKTDPITGWPTEFDPEGSGYDYLNWEGDSYNGHGPSFYGRTGLLLKGINHPSIHLTRAVEEELGNEIVKRGDRYYGQPKESSSGRLVDFGNPVENAVFGATQSLYDFGRAVKGRLWDLPVDFWLRAFNSVDLPNVRELIGVDEMQDVREAQLRSMGLLGQEATSDERAPEPTTGGVRN